MSGLRWDTSEPNRLSVDLSEAPGRAQRKAPAVFARGAFEIKKRLKAAASGHDHLPSLDAHVAYDKVGPLAFEIGFNKVGQGNLANIAVYGSVNNSPIMESPAQLARYEIPAIERHLGDAGEESALGTDSK